MPEWYSWQNNTLLLDVLVQPRARKDEIVGLHDNRLKIRITAPPADGKANAHLCRYLADIFGIPKSRAEVIAGQSGRVKRLCIHFDNKVIADQIVQKLLTPQSS